MRFAAGLSIPTLRAALALLAFTTVSINGAAGPTGASAETAAVAATSDLCTAEAAAYTDVADLAQSYREASDVFADALNELRAQLLDCLATSADLYSDGSAPTEDIRQRSI